ncbi:PTS sugar transporter subunit IIC [Lactobacillus crispatus]|uniref:PTS sugar transporter subunit IIC n=1 Tax=Lactobacillus crispatus TaxID=47770 RepID=UPI0030F9F6EE
MVNRITNIFLKLRRLAIFRIFQRTLVMLMPIAVIGTYFKLFRDAVFSPDSFIYNIFNFDITLPDRFWYAGAFVSRGMVRVTFGLFGIYAAYFAARYTARLYRKDSTMAGMTAVIVIMFCAYANNLANNASDHSPFSSSVLKINAVLLALLMGYGVGQIFHWLGKEHKPVDFEHAARIKERAWNAFIPTIFAIFCGIVLGIIIYEFQIKFLNSSTFKGLVTQIQESNNILLIALLTIPVFLLSWMGIGYPLASLSTTSNSISAAANLNFALKHGSAWNVPYKYLGSSLFYPYAEMGGASIVLAMIVIILIYSKNKDSENIAKVNLLPAAFGSTGGMMVGMPIILNPLLLPAIVIIPIINILLAAGAIFCHLIQPCAYPVLSGTPGILVSFFGSNGDWSNLVFSILLFILDIIMFIPTIKLGLRLERGLKDYEEKND